MALVDEAEAAISGPPRIYGHIVVDEAQDLSTMGLRALARRSRAASMTVLGDLAQATAPAAQESWDGAVAALGGPRTASGPTSTWATGSRRRSWTRPTVCWPRPRPA